MSDSEPTSPAIVVGRTRYGPFDVRWVEAGPSDGPPILLLHGLYAGAHSYEWRRLAPLLAASARVRTPDLLGAGESDRPALAYTPEILSDLVATIIADVGPDVHVVASSLTGAYAVRAAAAGVPMAALTLITPSGLGQPREAPRARRGHRLFDLLRATPVGDVVVYALTSGPSVSWFQRNKTYRDPSTLQPDEVRETRRAGRLPGAKHLQLAFVFDRLSIDLDPDDVERVAPIVVWAHGQDFVDDVERDHWAAAGATVVDLPSGLPQVEEPDAVASIILHRRVDT